MQDLERISPPASKPDEDYIDLLDMVRMLWKHKLLIASTTIVGAIGASIVAFSQPDIYTSTATIMPVDSSSDRLSAALSSLGSLGGFASQAGLGLKGSVSDKFVALLASRTIAENVVNKHALLPDLFPERWDAEHAQWKAPPAKFPWTKVETKTEPPTLNQGVRRLRRLIATKSDAKAGVVTLNVDHTNPQAAANIANHYVQELQVYLQGNFLTSAKRNKEFLETQLSKVTADLEKFETDLKSFQEQHKLVSLDAQTQAAVQAYSSLKSQLIAKQMEVSLLEKGVSEDDIQLMGAKQEVAALQEKLAMLERGESGGWLSFEETPKLSMRFAQLSRDLMVRQKVLELITQQYELAKIEEAKETLSFQVIDPAIPPERKSKPNRLMLILAATAALAVIVSAGVVLFEGLKKARAIPTSH